MNHLVTLEPSTKSEQSPATYAERRAAMADETRTRILDACVQILARGVAELSIPAVAREAGVSVPTVYRNFADKKTLVSETALYLRRLRGFGDQPGTLDELPASLLSQFKQSASVTETVRAALASEPVMQMRRDMGEYQRRLDRTAALLDDAMRGMSPHDRELAILMTTVLCSSATLRAFREVTGSTPERAAETVAWTIGRILGREWGTTTTNDSKARKQRAKGSKR